MSVITGWPQRSSRCLGPGLHLNEAGRDMSERTCSLCENPARARGLCQFHYGQSVRARANANRDLAGDKACRDCERTKPRSQFPKHSGYTDGFRPMCNDCYNAGVRAEWQADHNGIKAKQLARYRKFKYGATPERIASFLEAQGFMCPICEKPIGQAANDFHVDHDHDTGLMRGLLCHRCNRALGLFGDSENGLRAALVYLTKPPLGLDMARQEVEDTS